eukprot:TRINITY_DN84_c0_g1_i1.p1 TRINITY_DN84_c0_g1~~TRINITY_DN84_c0_g1_i1.p1  ORF type:complete len:586 (-),score=189.62 TRINITY_DN84_c0_g1_i1:722-2479(-)
MEKGLLYDTPKKDTWKNKPTRLKVKIILKLVITFALIGFSIYGGIHTMNQLISNHDALMDVEGQIDGVSATLAKTIPDNFAVPHPTSRRYQKSRGSCWDFATVAVPTHQYRLQGIKQGFLKETEEMQFSEQAFGVSMMEQCASSPTAKKICQTPDDRVAYQSTQGGETHLMWAFKEFFGDGGLLPQDDEDCPYMHDATYKSEHACKNIKEHQKKNPVRFEIKQFDSLYTIDDIKKRISENGHAMSFSCPIYEVLYYTPVPQKTDTSVPCPINGGYTSYWCESFRDNMYSMDGEFFKHNYYQMVDGHCMLLSGYSDTFISMAGHTGGFFLRNTWDDGNVSFDEFAVKLRPRGSHSLPYLQGKISQADERVLCPNAHNPRNWYACVSPKDKPTLDDDLEFCVGDAQDEAKVNYQPITLRCLGKSILGLTCDADTDEFEYRYFKRQTEQQIGDNLYNMVFLQVKTDKKTKKVVDKKVINYNEKNVPLGEFSKLFEPIEEQLNNLKNHDDWCGYYFYPYQVFKDMVLFGGSYVNDYSLEFHESSYAVNADKYPQYDYSLVKKATKSQMKMPEFPAQYPDARVDYYKQDN